MKRSFATRSNPTPLPEKYLAELENTASMAIEHIKTDKTTPEDRMRRASGRLFQILTYLGQSQEQAVENFEQAPLERLGQMFTYLYLVQLQDLEFFLGPSRSGQ